MPLYWQLFALFSRVALFSWGGGPASMALMQRETTAAGWVTPGEFADALAVGNALPGPIAPQVSAFIGYKLAGLPGALAATLGTVMPTTMLMLVMIVLFFGVKDSLAVQAMLTAVRPVVVGLLLWTTYDLAMTVYGVRKLGWGPAVAVHWDKILIALVTFAVLTFTKLNPALLILLAAAFGFFVYR